MKNCISAHAKIVKRSSGRSAVGASAYRAGEKLYNEHDGITHDYTKKSGVVHSEIMLCENAPKEYQDRETLWNAVEKVEKRGDAQLARDMMIALPTELDRQEQIKLVQEYVKDNFVNAGMCADVNIHDKGDGNPHAHIMLTMRAIDEQGDWKNKQQKEYVLDKDGNKQYDQKKQTYKCNTVKTTDWDEPTKVEEWRKDLADKINCEFERKDIPYKVDHRSFERQGIDQVPTIHLGSVAHQMEQNGIETDRGNHNRQAAEYNQQIAQINSTLENLKIEIQEVKKEIDIPEQSQTTEQVAAQLYSQEKEVLQTMNDIQNVRDFSIQLEQEKRTIPLAMDRIIEDSQNINNLYKHAKGLENKIAELKDQATIFRNNKSEIQSATHQLESAKNSFNQAVKTFTNDYEIKPNKTEIQEKLNSFTERLNELEKEQSKIPSKEVLKDREQTAQLDYKTNRLLAEQRPDFDKIKERVDLLEKSDRQAGAQKPSLNTIMQRQQLRTVSNTERKEIAQKTKDPSIAKKILEPIKSIPSKGQEQER